MCGCLICRNSQAEQSHTDGFRTFLDEFVLPNIVVRQQIYKHLALYNLYEEHMKSKFPNQQLHR